MEPMKLKVALCSFPYGGNGGVSSEHPDVRWWYLDTILKAKSDPRISAFVDFNESDTPITMTRNRAIQKARSIKADVLGMIDSDMSPDRELRDGDPLAKPFWDTAFSFIYDRWQQGPTVIGAPYCGPPPIENPYVFRWANWESHAPAAEDHPRVEAFSREEAAHRGGIEEVAALPTGLILFDMRIFDVIDPPYFKYEYTDKFEQQKASTEDVVCTRDVVLFGYLRNMPPTVFCAWDCWAGHWKPKCVRKPKPITADRIQQKYKDAVLRNHNSDERLVMFGEGKNRNGAAAIHHAGEANGRDLGAVAASKP